METGFPQANWRGGANENKRQEVAPISAHICTCSSWSFCSINPEIPLLKPVEVVSAIAVRVLNYIVIMQNRPYKTKWKQSMHQVTPLEKKKVGWSTLLVCATVPVLALEVPLPKNSLHPLKIQIVGHWKVKCYPYFVWKREDSGGNREYFQIGESFSDVRKK